MVSSRAKFTPPLLTFRIRTGSGMSGKSSKLAEDHTFLEVAGPCREPTETFTFLYRFNEFCDPAENAYKLGSTGALWRP